MDTQLKKTCLHECHVQLGAKMSPFGGFDMPIQYSGIIDEHNAVRNDVGVFDVSHMGEIFVSGPDSLNYVNHIFTNDVTKLEEGKILYGMMLYPDGGTVDDLLVYKEYDSEAFLLVVNASNIDKDYAWLLEQTSGFDVVVENRSDEWGQVAVQGPQAEKAVCEILGYPQAAALEFYTFCNVEVDGTRVIISRSGYTGEDGFEIYATPELTVKYWNQLLAAGVKPCGLGCRDTLRFEVGLPLYGDELTDEITPLEAGLGMFAKLDKNFIGRDALAAQKAEGLKRKIVGIELKDKAIPRHGYEVEADGKVIGVVTTGYNSISTGKSVCMAMLDIEYTKLDTEVAVRIRKKVFPGVVTKKRFYDKNYKK